MIPPYLTSGSTFNIRLLHWLDYFDSRTHMGTITLSIGPTAPHFSRNADFPTDGESPSSYGYNTPRNLPFKDAVAKRRTRSMGNLPRRPSVLTTPRGLRTGVALDVRLERRGRT